MLLFRYDPNVLDDLRPKGLLDDTRGTTNHKAPEAIVVRSRGEQDRQTRLNELLSSNMLQSRHEVSEMREGWHEFHHLEVLDLYEAYTTL